MNNPTDSVMQSFLRRFNRQVFVLVSMYLVLVPRTSFAQVPYHQISSDTLTVGVVHTHYRGTTDPLNLHALSVDITQPKLHLGVARAHHQFFGRQKTSEIARFWSSDRDSVLAAVNADFFNLNTGANENNQVINGTIVRGLDHTDSPYDTFDNIHTQFAITDRGIPLIERFRFHGQLISADPPLGIDGVNSSTDSSNLVIYNSYYGDVTPDSIGAGSGRSYTLSPIESNRDTTWYILLKTADGGAQKIPDDGAVLHAFGNSAEVLTGDFSANDTVITIMGFTPDYGQIQTLTGGWPRIVKNGQSVASEVDSIEGTFPKFSAFRHPRTGIGVSKDSTQIYLIIVDGRQESSSGMSLEEFADFMLSVGVYQGLNLDGGGSTTMVIDGKVINSPSDKSGERPVGNGLLLYIKK